MAWLAHMEVKKFDGAGAALIKAHTQLPHGDHPQAYLSLYALKEGTEGHLTISTHLTTVYPL